MPLDAAPLGGWDGLDAGKFRVEAECVADLLRRVPLDAGGRAAVGAEAEALVRAARDSVRRQGVVESFLQEFSLGTREGLALMCLAEALLRTPDEETRDRPSSQKYVLDALELMQEGRVIVHKDVAENALLTYIPVRVPVTERDGAFRQGGLEIAQPLTELDRFTADSLRNGIIASVAAVAIAGLLALVLGFLFIGRPVSRLAEKARRALRSFPPRWR